MIASLRLPPLRLPPLPPWLVARPDHPQEDIRPLAIAGGATLGAFVLVFGLWAAVAPLHGAVVAQGAVRVDGNRKSVQHLDGGILRELRVRDGDRVRAGDVLVLLDDTQARAEADVLEQQWAVLRATEARLVAELERRSAVVFPDELVSGGRTPYVRALMTGQVQQFDARRTALDGQQRVIGQRIAQFEEQIAGLRGSEQALRDQWTSIRAEVDSIRGLVERGVLARPRLLQLERSAQAIEGQIAENLASRARAEQSIGEQRQQVLQLENERLAEVTRDLRDTQAKLLDVIPRLHHARAVLDRTAVRAPYGGRIVQLAVFGQGSVIGRGERILDIVPDEMSLVVEAQIPVDEISEVQAGQHAEVQLTAYKQRQVPRIAGRILWVSADRLTDNRTGGAYYTVHVQVADTDLSGRPIPPLQPGMPVTVMVPTVERTALDYLLSPLTRSFDRAFRER